MNATRTEPRLMIPRMAMAVLAASFVGAACSSKDEAPSSGGGASGETSSGGGDEGGPGGAGGAALEMPDKPNFVILLADDLGFDDRGLKNPILDTPELDELASRSVRFDQFYTQPVCATTRAALLTGKQPNAVGVWDVHGGRDFLDLEETLLPELLQDSGYRTGMFGKWHNGFSSAYQPHLRGFDEAYAADLYDHFNNRMVHNGEGHPTSGWVTGALVDLAIEFIDDSVADERPFLAYVPFLAPHEPWEAPDEYKQPYLDAGQSDAMATVLGMVSHLDHQVGRLLQHLEDAGLSDDTVVVFMSDNGPWYKSSNGLALDAYEWRDRNPSGLKTNKGEVYENGVRAPLYVHFGAQLAPRDSRDLTGVQDVLPTLLELAGLDVPEGLDGRSFASTLLDETLQPGERSLFFQKHNVRVGGGGLAYGLTPDKASIAFEDQIYALRRGDYKLIQDYGQALYLYDVVSDPTETNDLSVSEAELLQSLKQEMEAMHDALMADDSSFGHATELIGFEGAENSVVSVRTAMNRAEGVTVSSWTSTGWETEGQFVEMHVEVQTAGTYDVGVVFEAGNASGTVLSLSLAGETISYSVDATHAKKVHPFGSMTLSAGESILRFEIATAGGDTTTDFIDRVFEFHFEAVH